MKKRKAPKEWKALPPEKGHPMPSLGWRLMKKVEVSPGKHKWICVMIGHQVVMKKLEEGLTAEQMVLKNEQLLLAIHH